MNHRLSSPSCFVQIESRMMISALERSSSCFSCRLGWKKMGQKAQGCFEVLLTNESACGLNCSCIRTLILEVSAASSAGKLSWVSSVVSFAGLRGSDPPREEGLRTAYLGSNLGCLPELPRGLPAVPPAWEGASAALAMGPRCGQQCRSSRHVIQQACVG